MTSTSASQLPDPATLIVLARMEPGQVEAQLLRVPASQWLALDRRLRQHTASPSGAGKLGALVVMSMTRSGFTRSDALAGLHGRRERLALIARLLRLDDAVPQVRAVAAAGLTAEVARAALPDLIEVLPIAQRLAERARARARPELRAIEGRLIAEVDDTVFDDRRVSDDARRALVGLMGGAADRPIAIRLRLLRDAVDVDRVTALRIARGVIADGRATPTDVAAVAAAISLSRLAAVRAGGCAVLARAGAHDALSALCVDRMASVRAAARTSLGKLGVGVEMQRDDVRARLDSLLLRQDALSDAVLGALGALGDVGRDEDAARLTPFLFDRRARVRAAAIAGLAGALSSHTLADYLDVLLEGVASSSSRVGVAAARALGKVAAERLRPADVRHAAAGGTAAARRALGRFIS